MERRIPLAPTPRERLLDAQGRPYFLWDIDMSLEAFERALATPDVEIHAYWLGKLMRQAKPDDVLTFARPEDIAASWPSVERYLGRSRPFWSWLLEQWKASGRVAR